MSDKIEPGWDGDIPFCDEECGQFDGKRCRLLGARPSLICEPAVKGMATALDDIATKTAGYQSWTMEDRIYRIARAAIAPASKGGKT